MNNKKIMMQVVTTTKALQENIIAQRNNKTVAFIPTMGAIHQGHLSLMKTAKNDGHLLVCSVFVNPIQFDRKEDFEKYPRTVENDCELLSEYVDILFLPTVEEIYPEAPVEVFDMGALETVMEGEKRPGHFQGVVAVVKRLFEYVKPDVAYFGEKDFQQLAIIRWMTEKWFPNLKIMGVPTLREESGLAMSSRNQRLSEQGKATAAKMYQVLSQINIDHFETPNDLKNEVIAKINAIEGMELEYFEIADRYTMQPVQSFDNDMVACVAYYVSPVRLIDNIKINKKNR